MRGWGGYFYTMLSKTLSPAMELTYRQRKVRKPALCLMPHYELRHKKNYLASDTVILSMSYCFK